MIKNSSEIINSKKREYSKYFVSVFRRSLVILEILNKSDLKNNTETSVISNIDVCSHALVMKNDVNVFSNNLKCCIHGKSKQTRLKEGVVYSKIMMVTFYQ